MAAKIGNFMQLLAGWWWKEASQNDWYWHNKYQELEEKGMREATQPRWGRGGEQDTSLSYLLVSMAVQSLTGLVGGFKGKQTSHLTLSLHKEARSLMSVPLSTATGWVIITTLCLLSLITSVSYF